MTRRRLTVAVVLGLGCATGRTRSVPPAAEEVIAATSGVTHAAVVRAVTDLGLPLRLTDAVAGVVETDYVDVSSYEPDAVSYPAGERRVRFRVLVAPDETDPASRLTVFAVYTPFRTGLSNVRRGERAIPSDHPAMDLVRRVVEEVRKIAEGG